MWLFADTSSSLCVRWTVDRYDTLSAVKVKGFKLQGTLQVWPYDTRRVCNFVPGFTKQLLKSGALTGRVAQ